MRLEVIYLESPIIPKGWPCSGASAKEWGALGDRAITPSAKSYKPKIYIRKVQGERTRLGALREGETDKGGTAIDRESQGGWINGQTKAAELVRRPGKVTVSA